MGRFYSITVETIPSASGSRTWGSQQNGVDNPGALDIEFDFFEYLYGVPSGDSGSSTLTIHGVSLQDLQSASNFYGRRLSMTAGMSAGYPLATPSQAGPIMSGSIFQSFGNWIGTDMTLDFVIVPSTFTIGFPGNFIFNWKPGTSLQSSLTQTISAAYANAPTQPSVVFQLSGTYAAQPNGHLTKYSTLSNLGAAVNSMTKAASPSRTGVTITFLNTGNTILVSDGAATQSNKIQIQFTDFVGQPTWVGNNTMQFTTVLRADINVNSIVQMPHGLQDAPGIVTTTAASFPSQFKYKTSFQGNFLITSVRQIGNFRDPNGNSWVSVFECVPI